MNRARHLAGRAVLVAVLLVGVAHAQDEATTVEVAEHAGIGMYLVNGEGMSLYLFASDEAGTPTCVGECAAAWPPVVVDGVVAFGEGVDLDLLGSVLRDDGSAQLTYADWPLYTFASDEAPGDVRGQGVNDAWFLVTPMGQAIQATSSPEEPASGADAEQMAAGADVYANVCAECHGAEGGGGFGPRLVGNDALGDAVDIAGKLINGFGYMPSFKGQLSDEELAAVLTYVRSSWDNAYGPVDPEEVASAR
jgi:predicted lipoprotein with Yx(FWY)xxD motif